MHTAFTMTVGVLFSIFFHFFTIEIMLLKQYIEINRELSHSYSGVWCSLEGLSRKFFEEIL